MQLDWPCPKNTEQQNLHHRTDMSSRRKKKVGSEPQSRKAHSLGGITGPPREQQPKIGTGKGSVSGHYVPACTKRLGEVRRGYFNSVSYNIIISSVYSTIIKIPCKFTFIIQMYNFTF